MKAIYLPLPLVLVLAACSSTLPPVPAPVPSLPVVRPAPTPPPARPPADWRDAPITPGTWSWGLDGKVSTARFLQPDGTELMRMSCYPELRKMELKLEPLRDGPMVITTTSIRRAIGTSMQTHPWATIAELDARDPLLDAMAFSRGRFMVEHGSNRIIAPSWPEVSRVIEDCR